MKFLLTFACLAVLVAVAVCDPKKECEPICKKDEQSPIICARLDRSKQCRRLRVCEMREANCRLEGRNKWAQANSGLCRNIHGATGSGSCNLRPPCWQCSRNEMKETRCYRSKDDQCRRRTPCQAKRHNCDRRQNQWKLADKKLCHGMKRNGEAAKCHKGMHN